MPRSLRGYELFEKIGSGGMSTIYRGVQKALDREVAIKILHPSLAGDEAYITRFEREARAASSLGHNNIVNVIDFDVEDEVYFIVMEYVRGTDLRRVMEKVTTIPLEAALTIIEEIALGLEAAHKNGVIHRDIKPGNVLLGENGVIKVVDFGLARRREDIDRLSALTVPGSVLGTPAYMSPEQATGHEVDYRSDIFSLGALAYELISGQRAFRGDSYSEIKEMVIRVPAPSLSSAAPFITPEIETMIDRMLAKDPARRYQNMSEVLRAIETAMETLDSPISVLKYRRRLLTQFSEDPIGFSKEIGKSRLTYHLDRGAYYMNMGLEQIDDAIRQFELVLRLDERNAQAGSALRKLRKRRADSGIELPQTPRRRVAWTGKTKKHIGALLALSLAVIMTIVGLLSRQLIPQPDRAVLVLDSVPPGAAIWVKGPDDSDFRSSGLRTAARMESLEPGEWFVRLEMDGMEPTEVRLDLKEGEVREVPVRLISVLLPQSAAGWGGDIDSTGQEPDSGSLVTPSDTVAPPVPEPKSSSPKPDKPARTPSHGYMIVYVKPYGDVYLDGRLIEKQKRRVSFPVSPGGSHVIELRHPSFGTHRWSDAAVAAGDTATFRHSFR